MRNDESGYDFHIGDMIKHIAIPKGITSKQLADTIGRYQKYASKIYQKEDMNVEDVVRLSFLLEYPILEKLCQKYLSHLPINGNISDQEPYVITFNLRTKRYTIHGNPGNSDFLKDIHLGQYIKKLAKKNRWSEQDVANLLQYTQGMVSDLYQHKSENVKKLFSISEALQHHLVYDLYLSRMMIVPSLASFNQCVITINGGNLHVGNPNDKTFSILFQPQDDEKPKK